MRFTTTHLFLLTAIVAVITALLLAGEVGLSLIPLLAVPQLFFLARFHNWKQCPDLLKTRYHLAVAIVLIAPMVGGVFEGIGWWQIPISMLLTFYIAPSILITLQIIKRQTPSEPNIELRIAQIVAVWLPTTMVALSFAYNTI